MRTRRISRGIHVFVVTNKTCPFLVRTRFLCIILNVWTLHWSLTFCGSRPRDSAFSCCEKRGEFFIKKLDWCDSCSQAEWTNEDEWCLRPNSNCVIVSWSVASSERKMGCGMACRQWHVENGMWMGRWNVVWGVECAEWIVEWNAHHTAYGR